MKKLLPVIIVIIVAVVLIVLFYSKKPTPQTSTTRSTQEAPSPAAQQPTKPLSFDSNDNLDRAFDDLQTIDGAKIP